MKKIDGWFAPTDQEIYFDKFIEKTFYTGYHKAILFAILFNKMGYNKICSRESRRYLCCDNCKISTSNFCRHESISKKKDIYVETNHYLLYLEIFDRITEHKDTITSIIGAPRYESFLEYLTHNALIDYQRYTKREIKENKLVKPKVFDAMFIGLEEIGADKWQQYVHKQIQQGDEECLHYLDSLFSA